MSIYFRIFVPPLCLFELILSYMYAISPAKITPTLQLKTVWQLEPLKYLVRILLAFDDNYRKVFLDFPILFEKGYDSRPGFRQNCSSFQLHTYPKDLNTFYDFTLPLYYMVWSSCVLPALPLLTNGKNISPLNHLKHVFL